MTKSPNAKKNTANIFEGFTIYKTRVSYRLKVIYLILYGFAMQRADDLLGGAGKQRIECLLAVPSRMWCDDDVVKLLQGRVLVDSLLGQNIQSCAGNLTCTSASMSASSSTRPPRISIHKDRRVLHFLKKSALMLFRVSSLSSRCIEIKSLWASNSSLETSVTPKSFTASGLMYGS